MKRLTILTALALVTVGLVGCEGGLLRNCSLFNRGNDWVPCGACETNYAPCDSCCAPACDSCGGGGCDSCGSGGFIGGGTTTTVPSLPQTYLPGPG